MRLLACMRAAGWLSAQQLGMYLLWRPDARHPCWAVTKLELRGDGSGAPLAAITLPQQLVNAAPILQDVQSCSTLTCRFAMSRASRLRSVICGVVDRSSQLSSGVIVRAVLERREHALVSTRPQPG
jgi:hypothetical protein